jgi:hypothetical protein
MSDPAKKFTDALEKTKPPPTPKSEKIYTVCGAALYPVWGLVSSAVLFNADFLHGWAIRSLTGIAAAGLYPVALHLYEVKIGKTDFEWKTVLISLSFGGIFSVFSGSILQGILWLCGIHNIFGLRLDTWYWKFPEPVD